jgi:hypothetical protein
MGNFDFGNYCTPAQLYLVLGAIGIISAFFKKFSIETLLTKALFLVIWAWVLNWLCSKGFKAISWILVLLPFILVLFMFLFIKDVARKEGFSISPGLTHLTGGGASVCGPACKQDEINNKNEACMASCEGDPRMTHNKCFKRCHG